MSAIIPFLFEGERVIRVTDREGDPWFVATDVCRILGLGNPTMAVRPLDDDEKGISSTETPSGQQDMIVVSEGGLYTLILRCRSATTPGTVAHRFRRWVTSEVLPAIRKTGAYAPAAAAVEPGDDMPESARLRMVTETRQSFGIAAAQQMWFEMKLPVVPAMLAARDQADLFQSGERGNQH